MRRTRQAGTLTRRAGIVGTGVAAAAIIAASAAWACTIHVGVMEVCAPPGSTACINSSTGGPGVTVSQSGSRISVKASGMRAERYAIYFQPPEKRIDGGLCSDEGTRLGRNVRGPSWNPVTRTTPSTQQTGSAQVCIREADGGVTGNGVGVTVI